ncbi:MAG: hypothetical protein ACJ73L_02500 [Actinomycetes bacterium]
MNLKHANGRFVSGLSGWAVDIAFWFAVAVLVLVGAFFLRHDSSPCSPEYEACQSD